MFVSGWFWFISCGSAVSLVSGDGVGAALIHRSVCWRLRWLEICRRLGWWSVGGERGVGGHLLQPHFLLLSAESEEVLPAVLLLVSLDGDDEVREGLRGREEEEQR